MSLKKSTRARLAAAAVAGALLTVSGIASASPVIYFGAQFNLSIADVGAPGGTYEVTYTADFTGFTNGSVQKYIDAIAWKHAGADVATASLSLFPGSGWTVTADSNVNANGCSANGGNTWACAQDSMPFVATTGIQTWVFQTTFAGALASLDTTGDSIKARFVNSDGVKVGDLLSCTLNDAQDDNCTSRTPPPPTSVPEPASLGLFGLGLIGLGLRRKRK